MSLFKKLFQTDSTNKEKPVLNWIPLVELDQLNEIYIKSNEKSVLIFKHSTRCGISSMALKRFENSFDIDTETMDIYFLDLLRFRNVSNEIALKFSVQHQSPQVLILKNKEVVYSESHSSISVEDIKKVIN